MTDADRYHAVTAARERFLAGDDRVRGVRPEIATSWYRCREQYHVDPGLTIAPPASEQDESSAEHTLEQIATMPRYAGGAIPADYERTLGEPAGQHPVRLGEPVHEARAPCGQVIGGRVGRSEAVGEDRSGRRERHVRRDRRHDQEVDVRALDTRLRERVDARR